MHAWQPAPLKIPLNSTYAHAADSPNGGLHEVPCPSGAKQMHCHSAGQELALSELATQISACQEASNFD